MNDYVTQAENIIISLKNKSKNKTFKFGGDKLTTNQVRKILSLTSKIYDKTLTRGVEAVRDDIAYLRIQLAYQSGRNKAVKEFVDTSRLIDRVKLIQTNLSKRNIVIFCRYVEALVAFFKYHGGQDS